MAYSDYGAFAYLDGERRTDKEDAGVYGTDGPSLPTGLRAHANILKLDGGGKWFEQPHHGAMGDGSVRVGCRKQGWPEACEREDGKDEPARYAFDDPSRKFGWGDCEQRGGKGRAAGEYDEEFDFPGRRFRFRGDDLGGTPEYGAAMSRDGETRECDHGYMFGAGLDDD